LIRERCSNGGKREDEMTGIEDHAPGRACKDEVNSAVDYFQRVDRAENELCDEVWSRIPPNLKRKKKERSTYIYSAGMDSNK
jgi:hypothetical protein